MIIKLVVGLGNPGKEYNNTRHNIGFMVIDNIAKQLGITNFKERDGAIFFDCYIGMHKVIFIKPQKYINLSGDVLIKFVDFFNIKTEDILVICDDLDQMVGCMKLKEKGSSGGHNGLKNIEQKLKTNNYKRLKIGISNNKEIDTKDYVLGKIPYSEKKQIDSMINKATEAVIMSINSPFNLVMNKYNTKKQMK